MRRTHSRARDEVEHSVIAAAVPWLQLWCKSSWHLNPDEIDWDRGDTSVTSSVASPIVVVSTGCLSDVCVKGYGDQGELVWLSGAAGADRERGSWGVQRAMWTKKESALRPSVGCESLPGTCCDSKSVLCSVHFDCPCPPCSWLPCAWCSCAVLVRLNLSPLCSSNWRADLAPDEVGLELSAMSCLANEDEVAEDALVCAPLGFEFFNPGRLRVQGGAKLSSCGSKHSVSKKKDTITESRSQVRSPLSFLSGKNTWQNSSTCQYLTSNRQTVCWDSEYRSNHVYMCTQRYESNYISHLPCITINSYIHIQYIQARTAYIHTKHKNKTNLTTLPRRRLTLNLILSTQGKCCAFWRCFVPLV